MDRDCKIRFVQVNTNTGTIVLAIMTLYIQCRISNMSNDYLFNLLNEFR